METIVNRYNRKLMMVSDLTAGLGSLAILILLTTDNLQVLGILKTGRKHTP